MNNKTKEFESELDVNPEFFGLFREELLNMNLKQYSSHNILNKLQSNNESENIGGEPENTDIKPTTNIKPTINIKPTTNIKPTIGIKPNTMDNIKAKDEQNEKFINKIDISNIKFDKYELDKLNEIIKYFVNINK